MATNGATQLEMARSGRISAEAEAAASADGVPPETIRRGLCEGSVVLPANRHHAGLRPAAIGAGLRVKVNANIGSSQQEADPEKAHITPRAAKRPDEGADGGRREGEETYVPHEGLLPLNAKWIPRNYRCLHAWVSVLGLFTVRSGQRSIAR